MVVEACCGWVMNLPGWFQQAGHTLWRCSLPVTRLMPYAVCGASFEAAAW